MIGSERRDAPARGFVRVDAGTRILIRKLIHRFIMTIVEIRIELKKGVADPEGKNTMKTLQSLGFQGIAGVKTVKLFEVDIDAPADKAEAEAEEMCKSLLANPVIQNYRVTVR